MAWWVAEGGKVETEVVGIGWGGEEWEIVGETSTVGIGMGGEELEEFKFKEKDDKMLEEETEPGLDKCVGRNVICGKTTGVPSEVDAKEVGEEENPLAAGNVISSKITCRDT